MSYTEIPLIEHIDIYEEQCEVYVHTKDQRVIRLQDVQDNGYLDDTGLYLDHLAMGLRFSFFLPREDFSHIEYRYSQREDVPRESETDFDELNSFIEEQFEDYKYPSESLTDPEEGLFEDLI